MKKIYLKDLSGEDLLKVLEVNCRLYDIVVEDYQYSEMGYAGDILMVLQGDSNALSNWDIGYGQKCYIRYRHAEDFLNNLLKAQRDFGLLGDEYTEKIRHLLSKYDTLYSMDMYTNNFDNLEAWLEGQAGGLADAAGYQFEKLLAWPRKEWIQEYFIEFYMDCRVDEGLYVLEGGDFTVFEDRTISYK